MPVNLLSFIVKRRFKGRQEFARVAEERAQQVDFSSTLPFLWTEVSEQATVDAEVTVDALPLLPPLLSATVVVVVVQLSFPCISLSNAISWLVLVVVSPGPLLPSPYSLCWHRRRLFLVRTTPRSFVENSSTTTTSTAGTVRAVAALVSVSAEAAVRNIITPRDILPRGRETKASEE